MRGFKIGLLLVGIAGIAAAQSAYGLSGIGVYPNNSSSGPAGVGGVQSLSETWADYSVLQYYDVVADGYLYEGTDIKQSYSLVDGYYVAYYLHWSYSLNQVYTLQTNHWVRSYFEFVQANITYWQDPFGFSFLSGGNSMGDQPTVYTPNMQPTVISYSDMYIGTTWVQDSTLEPQITGINVIGSQEPGASGYIEVYGSDLVKPFNWDGYTGWYQHSTGAISGGDVDVYVDWQDWHNPGQINLHYAIAQNATPGNRVLAIVSPYGTANYLYFQILNLVVSQSPPTLNLSTGDTNKTITTSVNSSGYTFTPTFASSVDTNPNSSCPAILGFSTNSGTGQATETVTATPSGCSGIFHVVATVNGVLSTGETQVVVPPQVMIKTIVGEMGGENSTAQMALLEVARNRFGDSDFPGGVTATWQAVLTPAQFYGANDPTADGPPVPLANASAVFTNNSGVSVGGAGVKCYWSPKYEQWTHVQDALNQPSTQFPSDTGAPGCWLNQGLPRQILYKAAVGLNHRGGEYANAPAILFLRVRAAQDPSVIEIQ